MEVTDILLTVVAAGLAFSTMLLTFQLRALSRRIDCAEDRADKRAAEDRARAAEDRAANKADHDKLFQLVAGLQGDVKVLRDRSDRSDRTDSAG